MYTIFLILAQKWDMAVRNLHVWGGAGQPTGKVVFFSNTHMVQHPGDDKLLSSISHFRSSTQISNRLSLQTENIWMSNTFSKPRRVSAPTPSSCFTTPSPTCTDYVMQTGSQNLDDKQHPPITETCRQCCLMVCLWASREWDHCPDANMKTQMMAILACLPGVGNPCKQHTSKYQQIQNACSIKINNV